MNNKNEPEMSRLREEDRLEKAWFADAEEQTPDTLGHFIKSIMELPHSYGTVCHAVAACAMAAIYAADNEPNGGITGFQSGVVMWDIIRQMNYRGNKTGLRIIDYDNLLYPQYEDRFDRTINKRVWELLQKEAKEKLESHQDAHPDVIEHWRSIVAGVVPFGLTVESTEDQNK